MQDNSTHNYDPALVDQGWSMLEKQLDEVLPQKTKRRFPWFWLVLLLGFFSLAGAGWHFTINQTEKEQIPQEAFQSAAIGQPIAGSAYQNTAIEEGAVPSSETTTSDADNNAISVASNVDISGTEVSAGSPSINDNIDRSLVNNEPSTAGTSPMAIVVDDQVAELLTSKEEQTIEHTEEIIPEEAIAAGDDIASGEAVRATDVTPLLASADLLLLEGTENELNLSSKTEPVKENIPEWRYFVEGQATVALGQQPGFLGGVVGAEHKLGPSWTLGFELGYERSQQVLTYNELSKSLGQNRENNAFTGAGSYSPDGYDLDSAYGAVTYDRFKSNIMAHYKLSPRWRIGTGLSVALYRQALFNPAEAGGAILDIEVNEIPTIGNTLYNLFEEPVAIFEYDESNNIISGPYPLIPNRWQLAGMLTGQYQINRNWGVNLTYRHDLTAWRSGAGFGTPSNLQFGLRYYIR